MAWDTSSRSIIRLIHCNPNVSPETLSTLTTILTLILSLSLLFLQKYYPPRGEADKEVAVVADIALELGLGLGLGLRLESGQRFRYAYTLTRNLNYIKKDRNSVDLAALGLGLGSELGSELGLRYPTIHPILILPTLTIPYL